MNKTGAIQHENNKPPQKNADLLSLKLVLFFYYREVSIMYEKVPPRYKRCFIS